LRPIARALWTYLGDSSLSTAGIKFDCLIVEYACGQKPLVRVRFFLEFLALLLSELWPRHYWHQNISACERL
jgi:hypothetical protein